LEAIKTSLQGLGYNPLFVRDVPDHPSQDLSQKVTMLGALARFVVIDDSSKSGHLVEINICRTNDWVTAVLRKEGAGSSYMTAGLSLHSQVILEQPYSPDSLDEAVAASVEWAERALLRLEANFNRTYPWRNGALS
jgi:hypothetical protein